MVKVMPKKYIVKATAEIKTTIETSAPEDIVISLQKRLLDVGVCSYNLSDVCIDEVTTLPENFKQSLYDKFTHGKG